VTVETDTVNGQLPILPIRPDPRDPMSIQTTPKATVPDQMRAFMQTFADCECDVCGRQDPAEFPTLTRLLAHTPALSARALRYPGGRPVLAAQMGLQARRSGRPALTEPRVRAELQAFVAERGEGPVLPRTKPFRIEANSLYQRMMRIYGSRANAAHALGLHLA
jgi:hypothetical protein